MRCGFTRDVNKTDDFGATLPTYAAGKYNAAEILLEDVVGIQVLGRMVGGGKACRVEIHSYPYVDLTKKDKRHFLLTTVDFSAHQTLAENVEAALEWKKDVLAECDNAVRKTFAFENDEEQGINTRSVIQCISIIHHQSKNYESG